MMKVVIAVITLGLVASAAGVRMARKATAAAPAAANSEPDRASRAQVVRDLCASAVLDAGGDQQRVIAECGAEIK